MANRYLLNSGFMLFVLICNCTYLRWANKIEETKQLTTQSPRQSDIKLLTPDSCLIVGGFARTEAMLDIPVCIVAFSFRYKKVEIVSTCQRKGAGFYSFMLPIGDYIIAGYADINDDDEFSMDEYIGGYNNGAIKKICSSNNSIGYDINLHFASISFQVGFDPIEVNDDNFENSLFENIGFGAIRKLNSKYFKKEIASNGMYFADDFLEHSHQFIYSPYKFDENKEPLLFIHGISGSPQDWKYVLKEVDTNRFSVLLFYYPSGASLKTISAILYNTILSGKVISFRHPLNIVAHSMGGIIAREAINLYDENGGGNHINKFVTICSPFKGMEYAEKAVRNAPYTVLSWQDLDPSGIFIRNLYRTKLPTEIHYTHVSAAIDKHSIDDEKASDGVVRLSSQNRKEAIMEADYRILYAENHSEILSNKMFITFLMNSLK